MAGSSAWVYIELTLSNVLEMNTLHQVANGLPAWTRGLMILSKRDLCSGCSVVISRGNMVTFKGRESVVGYAAMEAATIGGMVEDGVGDVRANILAVATASA